MKVEGGVHIISPNEMLRIPGIIESATGCVSPCMAGMNHFRNDFIIATLLDGDAPIWWRCFYCKFFHSFVLPTLHWQSGYFLRTYFAATPYTCQVPDMDKALSVSSEITIEQALG